MSPINPDKTLNLKYNAELSEFALELSPGEILITDARDIGTLKYSYNFGYIVNPTDDIPISPKCFNVATLIKIGHDPVPFPSEIFDEIIVVDDRPVKGGGLPDFWELTVARLIYELWKNPNITEIFLIGNQKYGQRTITELQNAEKWDESIIHKKTGIPIQIIRETKNRLYKVTIIEDNKELVKEISRYCKKEKRNLSHKRY